MTRAVLTAPVRGIVNRVVSTGVGGLAPAGEALVEVVPLDGQLMIEAFLAPEDVAFVRPGQDVKVRLTAYDASRYGALDGQILRVGADAVMRPDKDEQAFYLKNMALSPEQIRNLQST